MESSDSGVEHASVHERTKAKAQKSKAILISDDEIESPLTKRQQGEVAPAKRKRAAAQEADPLVSVKQQQTTAVQEKEVIVPAKPKRAAAAAPEGKPASKKSKASQTNTKLSSKPLPKACRGAANLPPKNPVTFTPSDLSFSEVPALALRRRGVDEAVGNALSGIAETLKAVADATRPVPPPAFLP
ncbi:hypothetical protein MMC07_009805, partial [Pseudocyphellaria aurata]|nr:hypothetical protein [Pseudocyphellaria aurata]